MLRTKKLNMENKTTQRVAIIAVGNGGYNLANAIIDSAIFDNPQLIIVDTDKDELESKRDGISDSVTKTVLIEPAIDGKDDVDISGIVPDDVDIVVICSTLGGKTGTRYAPLIAMDAQFKGKQVYSLCSLPFMFEGVSRVARARAAAEKLEIASNIFMIQNNDKLQELNSITMAEIDCTMIKMFKEVMEGLDFPMRTCALLQDRFDPITITFPDLSKEERMEKFDKA